MTWDPFARPKPMIAAARVVRNLTDDEEGDEIMPKGIYDRKPRGDQEEPANDAAKPMRAVRKPRAEGKGHRVVRVSPKPATGRFEVALDLHAGAVTINASAGSLTLAPDEIAALFAFLARR